MVVVAEVLVGGAGGRGSAPETGAGKAVLASKAGATLEKTSEAEERRRVFEAAEGDRATSAAAGELPPFSVAPAVAACALPPLLLSDAGAGALSRALGTVEVVGLAIGDRLAKL